MDNNQENKAVASEPQTSEHFTLYPLPEVRRGPKSEYHRTVVKTDAGEILVFEFDFVPVNAFQIPWEELESHIPHTCSTCEWKELRGHGTAYCGIPIEVTEESCPEWEISPDSLSLAKAEYYKALHQKHYGTACISL